MNNPKWLKQLFYKWSGHVDTVIEKTSPEINQALQDATQRGISIGESHVPPPVYVETWENTCKRHAMPLTTQTVQLTDGTLVEGWFCSCWSDHSTAPMPTVRLAFPEPGEPHTDRIQQIRPNQVYNHARKTGAGVHTAILRAMPRPTQDLSKIKGVHNER